MKKVFLWGMGSFFACAFLWVVAVIFSVLTAGKWSAAANIFGYASLAIIPLTLLAVLIKKFRGQ